MISHDMVSHPMIISAHLCSSLLHITNWLGFGNFRMLVFCMEFDHERIVYVILNAVGKIVPWAQLMCAESLENGSLQKILSS